MTNNMMGIVYAKPEAAGALRPAGQSQRMFVSVDEIRVEPFSRILHQSLPWNMASMIIKAAVRRCLLPGIELAWFS